MCNLSVFCYLSYMKTAVHIADRVRLMIATKQFQVGEQLPSTRNLAKQLGTSFHTVRKAYQQLVTENLVRTEKGKGFVVHNQSAMLSTEQKMEKGADRIRVMLEELVGFGLNEDDIETLFDEQLSFIEWPERNEANGVVGETEEISEMISLALRRQIGIKSNYITLENLDEAVKFDTIFVPLPHFLHVKRQIESTPTIPLVLNIDTDVLIHITERATSATIGLVTSEEDSVPILLNQLKASLAFDGPIIAGTVYGNSLPLFVRETDLIIYTPSISKLAERQLPERKRVKLAYALSERSGEIVRSELWDD